MVLVECPEQRQRAARHGRSGGREVARHGPTFPRRLPASGSAGAATAPGRRTLLLVREQRACHPGRHRRRDRRDHQGLRTRGRGGDPAAARLPALPQQPAAAPDQGPPSRRPRGRRAVGAGLRAPRRRRPRGRPDRPARWRADRRTDGGHRSGARRRRPAGAAPAGRDLAGQRRRSLRPPARPASGGDRPELHRRRSLPDRRRRHATGSPRSSPAPIPGRTTATPGGRRTSTSRCSGPSSPSGSSPRCTFPGTHCSPSTRSTSRSSTRGPATGSWRRTTTTCPEHEWCTGYRWDIVLTGSHRTLTDGETESTHERT